MTGFTWKRGIEKNLFKKLYRKQRRLATNHPDEMIANPQECQKQKNKDPLLEHCAVKIREAHEAYQRKSATPTIKTEKRFNRF